MIKELVEDSFISNHIDDPLEACLTHSDLFFNDDSAIAEVSALLIAPPSMDITKWKTKSNHCLIIRRRLAHLQRHHQNWSSKHCLTLWNMHSWENLTLYLLLFLLPSILSKKVSC